MRPPLEWHELVRALWPVFAVLTGLIVSAIVMALATKFATVVAVEAIKARVTKLEEFRVGQEAALTVLPTRQRLAEEVAELGERMARVESGIEGLKDVGRTTNTYLHTLIDAGVRRA